MRTITALAAAAALLLAAGPALAQTPPAASAPSAAALQEKVEIGRQIWVVFLEPLDLRDKSIAKMASIDEKACPAGSHPKCRQFYREAVAEEFDAEFRQLQTNLGRALAEGLSVAELKAGLAFLSDPKVRAAMAQYGRDRTEKNSAALDVVSADFNATPEGRAFGAQMDKVDINVVGKDFMSDSVDNVDRRLREKLAAEAAR